MRTPIFPRCTTQIMAGLSGKLNYLHIAFMSHIMLASLRNKLLPGVFAPPCFTGAPMRRIVPYSEVSRLLHC